MSQKAQPREKIALGFAENIVAIAKALFASVMDRSTVIRFFKSAGAKTEDASKRDGFLSYHAESHAVGMGLAAGWYFGAVGETKLLSLVYGAAVHGKAHARNGKRRRIFVDVKQEPHYALGAVVLGAILGRLTSVGMDAAGFSLVDLVTQFLLIANLMA